MHSNTLDELDLRILKALEEDARRSCKNIAESLRVATGTIYNRIKKMTDNGTIKGYVPLIDSAKVGYNLTALILAQVEGEHLVDVEQTLASSNGIMAVYDITGEFDVAIIARFRDRSSLNAFIKSTLRIPHVKRTVTNVVLNVVKEDFRMKL